MFYFQITNVNGNLYPKKIINETKTCTIIKIQTKKKINRIDIRDLILNNNLELSPGSMIYKVDMFQLVLLTDQFFIINVSASPGLNQKDPAWFIEECLPQVREVMGLIHARLLRRGVIIFNDPFQYNVTGTPECRVPTF